MMEQWNDVECTHTLIELALWLDFILFDSSGILQKVLWIYIKQGLLYSEEKKLIKPIYDAPCKESDDVDFIIYLHKWRDH